MSTKQTLLDKIERGEASLGVVGMGYVGLPLAMVFADAGIKVVGFDVVQARADQLNRGDRTSRTSPPSSVNAMIGRRPLPRHDRLHATWPTSRRDLHLRAHAAQQDRATPTSRTSMAATEQIAEVPAHGHAHRPRVDHLPRHHARGDPARCSKRTASRSARTSSSPSAPSASIRAAWTTRPRPPPRSSAASRPACLEVSAARSTARPSTPSCRVLEPRGRRDGRSCWRTPSARSTSASSTRCSSCATSSASTPGRSSTPPPPSPSAS